MLKTFKDSILNTISNHINFLNVGQKSQEIPVKIIKQHFFGFRIHKGSDFYHDLVSTFSPSEIIRLGKNYPELMASRNLFQNELFTENGKNSNYAIFAVKLKSNEIIIDKETNEVTLNPTSSVAERLNYAIFKVPEYLDEIKDKTPKVFHSFKKIADNVSVH